LAPKQASTHPPRILMLYGSLRERSYSKLLTLEATRLLEAMGAEVKVFDPLGLPQPDAAPDSHPKVEELRDLAAWSEGMVWCSPERHGAMTGIMKSQIDWIPLSVGAVRPTQGKTLAGENLGSDGGQRRVAIFQCREPNANTWPLDADVDDSKSELCGQSFFRV
ncbi:MAG: arsenical resistance protein ArsH, partial [Pseudomonadota bacterium]